MQFRYSAFADESSNTFSGQIDALKRNGYDYIELRFINGFDATTLPIVHAKEISAILKDHGLRVWSLGSPIGKIPVEANFNKHLELYRHALNLTKELHTDQIRLFSFYIPDRKDPNDFKNLILDRMAMFCEIAKEYDVLVCHENEKGIYGDIAKRCLDIHRAVPEIKAVFDPANFIQCGQDTLQAWELLHDHVRYMHIKDALPNGSVVPAGSGIGNLKTLIANYLAQGGQILTLEPHLYGFDDLQELEKSESKSQIGAMSFSSAEEAFDYAATALKQLMEEIT